MNNPFIIISCPIYKRASILPRWFAAIEQQTIPLDQIGFIFNTSPNDDETVLELLNFAEVHPELRCFEILVNDKVIHKTHGPNGERKWKPEQYQVMAQLRNEILEHAVVRNPDRLFSLDSDIILTDPETIQKLYDLDLDAVAPLTYMTPKGQHFPNVMTWRNDPGGPASRTHLYPIGQLFSVDIIMACVMMKPNVYQKVRYVVHRQGEDLGWSNQCAQHGIKLYSASHIEVKHIMTPQMLTDLQ